MTHRSGNDEFSLIVRPRELSGQAAVWTLDLSEDERRGLAERFGLLGLASLHLDLVLQWLAGRHLLRLAGRVRAEVTQQCVVTLQPVEGRIDAPFEILYAEPQDANGEVTVDLDDVEPLEGEELDIGEAAAEEFALMLDPYPRAPGATLSLPDEAAGDGGGTGERVPEGRQRPFEVLAALKRNK